MKPALPLLLVLLLVPFVSCERPGRSAGARDSKKAPWTDGGDAVRRDLPEGVVSAPQLKYLHLHAVSVFVASQGFGNSRLQFPHVDRGKEMLTDINKGRWRLESMELVSPLKHDPAQVYRYEYQDLHKIAEVMEEREKDERVDRKEFQLPRRQRFLEMVPGW